MPCFAFVIRDNMEPEKIVILDFTSGEVFILDYDSNIYDDPEDFFSIPEMDNFNMNTCEFMIVKASEFQIKFHP